METPNIHAVVRLGTDHASPEFLSHAVGNAERLIRVANQGIEPPPEMLTGRWFEPVGSGKWKQIINDDMN